MLARMQRKGNPLTLLVRMQAGTAILENNVELPQEVKNRATPWPSNCTTRYLSKGLEKNTDLKGHMHPDVYSSIIYNTQIMETAQVPIYWWMDKEDIVYMEYTHTHTHTHEYYSAIKKEWNLAIHNNVDGARLYYAKRNKRKTNTIWFHSCGI